MLAGKYYHQIDEKGRIRIPAKLKDQLQNKLFITKGVDKRLLVYSEEVAEQTLEKLKNDNFATSPMSKMRLQFLSSAIIAEYDSQGRTQLSEELIKYAGINKNVITIGNLDRLEIWSEENWNATQVVSDEDYDETLKETAKYIAEFIR